MSTDPSCSRSGDSAIRYGVSIGHTVCCSSLMGRVASAASMNCAAVLSSMRQWRRYVGCRTAACAAIRASCESVSPGVSVKAWLTTMVVSRDFPSDVCGDSKSSIVTESHCLWCMAQARSSMKSVEATFRSD